LTIVFLSRSTSTVSGFVRTGSVIRKQARRAIRISNERAGVLARAEREGVVVGAVGEAFRREAVPRAEV
jgi:hypothetical protein